MSKRIVRHRPNSSMAPFDSSLRNFFGDFWGGSPFLQDSFFDTNESAQYQFSPALDVQEEEQKFIAKMDLPGFDPEDVSVEIEDGSLIVHGNRDSSSEDKTGKYLRNERMSGSFYQKLQFPTSADLEQAECSSKNGVLTIDIPKKEESQRRSLKVKLLK